VGELQGAAKGLAFRHHLVDQSHGPRLVGADGPAGEDHLQRPAETDDARQTLGAAVDQGDSEAPFETTEDGRLVGDPQIAPAGDF